jgi:hypothetical protein
MNSLKAGMRIKSAECLLKFQYNLLKLAIFSFPARPQLIMRAVQCRFEPKGQIKDEYDGKFHDLDPIANQFVVCTTTEYT